MVTAQLTQQSMNRLNQSLDEISTAINKDMAGLVKQSSVHFVRSVITKTGPSKSSISRMAQKYKYRPVVKAAEAKINAYQLPNGRTYNIPLGQKGFFYQRDGGKIFSTPRPISRAKRRGYSRVKEVKKFPSAIKYWNKKKSAWDYIPTMKKGKWDKSDKRAKIPNAGAAKAGWLGVLKQMGQPAEAHGIGTRHSRYSFRSSGSTSGAELVNKIDYAGKKWPFAVPEALKSTDNHIRGIYKNRINKKIRAIR